jgi:hypothetical protein
MEQPNVFIEYHEYSRGLEAHFVGDGERPSWLPSRDAVGLHNEIELKAGDYAVEVARFREKSGRRITWIGCFTHAVDKIHGNRGNYCGAGVWLLDTFPLYATLIISGLEGLCRVLIESNDASVRHAQSNSFRTGYMHQYVRDLNLLPVDLPGMEFSASDVNETAYFRVPRTAGDNGFSSIGRSILQLCTAAPAGFSSSRVLYFLANDSAVKVPAEKVRDLPSRSDGAPEVLDRLLNVFFAYTPSQNAMKLELATAKKALGEKDAVVESYKAERARLEAEKSRLEAEKARLENSNVQLENERIRLMRSVPAPSDSGGAPQEYERKAQLQDLVNGQISRVDTISKDMESIKAAMKNRIIVPIERFYWIAGIVGALCLLSVVLSFVSIAKIGDLSRTTDRSAEVNDTRPAAAANDSKENEMTSGNPSPDVAIPPPPDHR